MSDADVKDIEKQVTAEVEEAVKFADESPKPVSASCRPPQACILSGSVMACQLPSCHCAVSCFACCGHVASHVHCTGHDGRWVCTKHACSPPCYVTLRYDRYTTVCMTNSADQLRANGQSSVYANSSSQDIAPKSNSQVMVNAAYYTSCYTCLGAAGEGPALGKCVC